MNFVFDHVNINVTDLDKSIAFYSEALGLEIDHRSPSGDGSFELVFLRDGSTGAIMELTWLRDKQGPYNLGDNETHLCFRTTKEEYQAAREKHRAMGCICFENPAMGIYFISDPDGYWTEIVSR